MSDHLFNDGDDHNDSPVIGILAQPWVSAVKDKDGKTIDYIQMDFYPHRQYLVASYVKWVEQAGARAVPINFYSTRAELEELLPKLNGALFPGGDGNYPPQIATIIDVIVKLNESGHYFPLWATCLGFQYVSTYFGLRNGWTPKKDLNESNFNFLGDYPVHNQSNRLEFTPEAKQSKWYQDMSPLLQSAYANENVTANFHNYGVSIENYDKFLQKDLILVSSAYADVAIAKDEQDKIVLLPGDQLVPHPSEDDTVLHRRFHATHLEHRTFPIFACQYHPERTLFEWGYINTGEQYQKISRSRSAIMASQYSATWFVFACRKSPGYFKSLNELNSKLIYNYQKCRFGKGVVEIYWFDQWYCKEADDVIVEQGYHYNPPNVHHTGPHPYNGITAPTTPNTGNSRIIYTQQQQPRPTETVSPSAANELSLVAPSI